MKRTALSLEESRRMVLIVLFACLVAALVAGSLAKSAWAAGPFWPAVDYPVGGNGPNSVAKADFDGDGNTDFATANADDTNDKDVSILLGNGNGTLKEASTLPVGDGTESIISADYNGDGKADLATAHSTGAIHVLLGNGDGTFQTDIAPVWNGGGSVGSMDLSVTNNDANKDGHTDLVVLVGDAGAGRSVIIFELNDGAGNFEHPMREYEGAPRLSSIVSTDLDNDGDAFDVVGVGADMDSVEHYLGNDRGELEQRLHTTRTGELDENGNRLPGDPFSALVSGDFDNDSFPDFAARRTTGGLLTFTGNLFFRDGSSGVLKNYAVGGEDGAGSVASGDFNGDSKVDLATSRLDSTGAHQVSVLEGVGDGTFGEAQQFGAGSGVDTSLVSADLNKDGKHDMAGTYRSSDPSSPDNLAVVLTYTFEGFFSPVDNPPTENKAKAGKTIPVRFSLGGDHGTNIFEAGYPKAEDCTKDPAAATDEIEQTTTGSMSELSYDPGPDRYTYAWATEATWRGCKRLVMKLKDGSVHEAIFDFRK